MKIINNQDSFLHEELQSFLTRESQIHLSCNHFTAFAFFELIEAFSQVKSIKVLLDLDLADEKNFSLLYTQREKSINLLLDRKYKINQVIGLLEDKAEIRQGSTANQNLLIVKNPDKTHCFILTPENYDLATLGVLPDNHSIAISVLPNADSSFLPIFNSSWSNSNEIITQQVIHKLQVGTKDYTGEEIYKYSIRQIFKYSAVDKRVAEKLEKVGFKDSKIWDMLYNFQKDAVIGAIEKIETYGGCIIADSVGLGKTFEALAVIKYYELRNDRVLVLAPKKLRDNWTVYCMNDKRNILNSDRLNYDVLNHTDLTRERGKSGDMDLETIHWGNYDLVVIDESHNFRNNPNKREGMTRYKRLMNHVIKANIRTKVLMLSATPVNNRMNDLKNQIAFITEGDDRAFSPYGINSISQVMRDAQKRFKAWFRNTDPENPDVSQLMEQLDGSYFRVLDMLTIARSRKHIEKYYDTQDIGKFPTRLTPITVTPPIDIKNQFQHIGQVFDELSSLEWAVYTPLKYVRSDKEDFYAQKYDIQVSDNSTFRMADREQSLVYLMRINFLKRLESSVYAFKVTLERTLNNIQTTLKHIENNHTGSPTLNFDITDIDIDDTEFEDHLVGGKTKVLIQDLDLIRWKQDLQNDCDILTNLLDSIKKIDPQRDAKLAQLKKLISEKINNPINTDNKKVIVFTAFADTAAYLYRQLAPSFKKKEKLYSSLITGGGSNKTNLPDCQKDLNSLLINFSPKSKKRADIYPDADHEIDLLFCTDCISEGQNLQDCDYLINYDIHWNPVRIIQRFGRIDRIGSVNNSIQLVNFFPDLELDTFIDLIGRVKGKMVMLDVSATGEDNIIARDSKEMQDLDYRKRQLKQLQDQVLDMEDVQGNISITDLNFNDFKIDLDKSTKDQIAALDRIPEASYAVVESNIEGLKPGVIFCLKDKEEDLQNKLRNNILYPFFLVYVSTDGSDMIKATQTKVALDYFRKLCMGQDTILPALIAEFDKETQNGKKTEHYRNLLQQTVKEVTGVRETIGLNSLATSGGTTLFAPTVEEDDSLELISYLIIR